ncbi:MAG: hypothetical protein JWP95_310 [Actinotalea sp.]|nr:hypothetical protein [Actinotalea sp.]
MDTPAVRRSRGCASVAVLRTLHPLWGAPLQADDIVEVLSSPRR